MSNYPPDIRQYDDDYRSPFYTGGDDKCAACEWSDDCGLEPGPFCEGDRAELEEEKEDDGY